MRAYAKKEIVKGVLIGKIRMTQKEGCILKVLEIEDNKSNLVTSQLNIEDNIRCKEYLLEKIKSTGKYHETNLTMDEINIMLDNFINETQTEYQDFEDGKILLVPIFYDGWKLPNENEIDIENLIADSNPGEYLLCRLSRSLKRDRFYCRYIKNITKNIQSGNGIEKGKNEIFKE